MKYFVRKIFFLGSLWLLGCQPGQAQPRPPCPLSPQTDTVGISIIDSSRVVVVGQVHRDKVTGLTLRGRYDIDTNQDLTGTSADEMGVSSSPSGYSSGAFVEGLKDGPWQYVHYAEHEKDWWECYHLGQLISTTAPHPVPPQHRREKRKKSCH